MTNDPKTPSGYPAISECDCVEPDCPYDHPTVSPDVCPSCGWTQANVANPSYPGHRACYRCGY